MIAWQEFPKSRFWRSLLVATMMSIVVPVAFASACPHAFIGESTTRLLVALPSAAGDYALWVPSAAAEACDQTAEADEVHAGAMNERQIRNGVLVPLDLHAKAQSSIELLVGSASAPAVPDGIERRWVTQTSADYLLVSNGVINLSGIEYIGGKPGSSIRSVDLAAGRWAVRAYHLAWPTLAKRDPGALYPPQLLVTINPASSDHGPFRTAPATFAKAP